MTTSLIRSVLTAAALAASCAQAQRLHTHVPAAIASSRPVGRLNASDRMNLAIGLPLRNPEELETLLQQITDPTSANYRHYLTVGAFAARFGPSEEDYQTLAEYLRARGFEITATHP